MAGETFSVEHQLTPDYEAVEIANQYVEWDSFRRPKIEEWKELTKYLYATDTRTTTNAPLPWSNSTTTPKLTQILDNLHANYFAALFPNRNWMKWEAGSEDETGTRKAWAVENYMRHSMDKSGFINTVSDLLYDYIQYGNCFAIVEHVNEQFEDAVGDISTRYYGPKLKRISPYDITFNPAAVSFEATPKIIRSIVDIGEFKKSIKGSRKKNSVFKRLVENRNAVLSASDVDKASSFIADGFGSITQYYESNYVEVLTFYGNLYNRDTGVLHENREITVIDRAYVLENKKFESWLGTAPIFHAGWRPRPDNLYAMGPLDNLVGMQYRLDHLENLKADVFDQIGYPTRVIAGDVEEFNWGPGEDIYVGEEGDVRYLAPDATALQADFQIDALLMRMEEMAGAPKQAMGIRTPGEKTAFEVQRLENSSSRIFQHKTAHYERVFIEKILNAKLEIGRRYMSGSQEISVPAVNSDNNTNFFMTITKEDLLGQGKLVPLGARHFAERAARVQQVQNIHAMAVQDPMLGAHLSRVKMAEILAYELGEEELYGKNVAVQEQQETAATAQDAEVDNLENQMIDAERGV